MWVSADGHNWHQSLPPMSRYRCFPKTVSSASPECLIVVGGDGNCKLGKPDRTLEVLFCGRWISAQLPLHAYKYDSLDGITIHNGSLYIFNTTHHDISCCKVESLLANCTQTGEDHGKQLWKTVQPLVHSSDFVMLSLEQHLLAICEGGSTYVYSPNTQSWVLFMDDNRLPKYKLTLRAATVRDHIIVIKSDKYLHCLEATGNNLTCTAY